MNNDRALPDKLRKPKKIFDILFNYIIDCFKEINISWPKTFKLSTAKYFAKKPFNQCFGTLPVTMNILLKGPLPFQLALKNSKI